MKRILVHAGYPKAASTTLQNGLFLQLHRQNVINFLGRAFESDYFGATASKRGFKNWTSAVIEQKPDDSIGPLSDTVLNFLSEGLFMMNERHNDRIATPVQLRDHFASKADKLEVLLIIRAQQTLVPSYYIQNHLRMKQSDFGGFLADNIRENWAREGKIFNFHGVLRAYADALGKDNVHPILFEDFVSNRKAFSAALASVMDIPVGLIEKNLGETHLNQTKAEDGVVVIKKHAKGLRNTAIKLLGLVSADAANALRIRIPPVSAAQKRAVFDAFKDSNEKLAEEFSLDKARMREYGYF